MPDQAATSHTFQFTITVQNTGNTSWGQADGFALELTSDPCGIATAGTLTIPEGAIIPPGGTVIFTGSFLGPSTEGSCGLQYRMKHDVVFIGPPVDQTINFVNFVNNAQFLSDTIPASIVPNGGVWVGITVRNTGNTQWGAAPGFRLSTVTDECALLLSPSVAVDQIVGPNQSIQMLLFLDAPASPDTCDLSLQMEEAGNGLFGQVFSRAIVIAEPPNAVGRWALYE